MAQRLVQLQTERQDYETPMAVVAALEARYGPFEIDFAATEANKKAPRCFTPAQDSLQQDWTGLRGYLNPPYGRMTGPFVRKGVTSKARTTCLLPARTDTKWFHAYIWDAEKHRPRPNVVAFELRKGRIKFENPAGNDLRYSDCSSCQAWDILASLGERPARVSQSQTEVVAGVQGPGHQPAGVMVEVANGGKA